MIYSNQLHTFSGTYKMICRMILLMSSCGRNSCKVGCSKKLSVGEQATLRHFGYEVTFVTDSFGSYYQINWEG